MKDKSGKVIGFEKLNYSGSGSEVSQFAFETVTTTTTSTTSNQKAIGKIEKN
jgi:hypothetical protein